MKGIQKANGYHKEKQCMDRSHSRRSKPIKQLILTQNGFPEGSVVKNPPANAGDTGDALEEETTSGAWWATVHGIAKSQKRLSD